MDTHITYLTAISTGLPWLIALLIAWVMGECVYRWVRLPRISTYGLVGFVLAACQLVPLDNAKEIIFFLANIALGLLLFEFSYRVNLRWLRVNPWIGIAGLVEASTTFFVIYGLTQYYYGMPMPMAVLLATLSIATSPVIILRIIDEQRSAGQVTQRALHLCALNCVLAVIIFKILAGVMIFETSGKWWLAVYSSLINLCLSIGLGAMLGIGIPILLKALEKVTHEGMVVFAIAIIFLVILTHSLKLSPILATLTFGMVARNRREVLNHTSSGFGALSNLLTVLLFVFVSSILKWDTIVVGMGLGLLVVIVRGITKTIGITIFSRVSGISWRKGLLTALAGMPFSASLILVLEQTQELDLQLFHQLVPLATVTLLLEIGGGPLLTQYALIWAGETATSKEDHYAS